MTTTHREHQHVARRAPDVGRPLKLALLMVALIGGFYVLREHWSHVAGHWIYLLLLACPLMHLFHGHGGHGGHGGDRSAADPRGDKED
jgi:hypothetical protein